MPKIHWWKLLAPIALAMGGCALDEEPSVTTNEDELVSGEVTPSEAGGTQDDAPTLVVQKCDYPTCMYYCMQTGTFASCHPICNGDC